MACGRYHHEIKSGVLIHEVERRACVPDHHCYWIGMSCRAIILAGGDCQYSCCYEDLCNNVCSLVADKLLTAGAYMTGVLCLYKLTRVSWHYLKSTSITNRSLFKHSTIFKSNWGLRRRGRRVSFAHNALLNMNVRHLGALLAFCGIRKLLARTLFPNF